MDTLFSLAISIVPYLCDCLALRYNRLRDLPENIRTLRSEMDELNCIKSDLERRVDEQERALKKPLSQVIHWLQKADDLEKQVNNLARKRCLSGCCPDFLSDCNLGKEVLRLTNEVVEHKGNGSFDVVAETPLPDRGEVFDNVNIVGDEQTLNDIRDLIQKEDVKIIGIYGMGGVGKTTLSKKINNEFVQKSQPFDVVIWAVVSQPVNVKNIQREIAKRLGLPFSDDEDQETRANKLLTGLSTRKFLLLFDDLWKPLDLRGIGVPTTTTQKESKIVFTTRSLSVCSDMDAHEKIQVKGLPEEEAWALFQNNVGEVVKDPSIFTLAKDVAKKCDGLPLALVTVAHATANRTTPEEWEDALTILNKGRWFFFKKDRFARKDCHGQKNIY